MSDEQPPVSLPSADPPGAREGPELPPRKPAQEVEGVEGGEPVSMEGTPGGQPVLVQFEGEDGPPRRARLVARSSGQSLAPTTTEQEDITHAGQREINRIWEFTQAGIALSITLAVIYTAVAGIESQILTSGFFLIIGFYFSRVNHQNIGGIGRKATDYPQKYLGR